MAISPKEDLKGVLSSRRKYELKKMLKSLSSKTKSLIKEVVLDMCPLYKRTVQEELPNSKIVGELLTASMTNFTLNLEAKLMKLMIN